MLLTEAVARYYFKLLAYKDEYEVARLFASPGFKESLDQSFEGDFRIEFNLAAPILAKKDPVTGKFQLLLPLRPLRPRTTPLPEENP